MTSVNDLLDLLILDEVEEHQFKGLSKTVGSPTVFGGQVLAQALNAASRTITNNRILHSMHAYFLEAGDLLAPEPAHKLYEHIYSAGNKQDPMQAYIAFRGRAPTVTPLLTKRGLA